MTQKKTLVASPISASAFSPYGWLVSPRADGDEFDPDLEPRLEGFDASSPPASASSPTPRLYVMRLPAARGRTFSDIARHDKVTQTLCCLGRDLPWLLAVARAEIARPALSDLVAFAVPARVAVALRKGTWHAGPLFDAPERKEEGQGGVGPAAETAEEGKEKEDDSGVDFLNLELSDTNSRDRTLFEFKSSSSGEAEEIEVLWPAAPAECGGGRENV